MKPTRTDMGQQLTRRWKDEDGTLTWTSTVLAAAILCFGALVGLVTFRDHMVQQYGDVGVGLDQLDQSWSYSDGIDTNGEGDYTDPGECEFGAEFVDSSSLDDPMGGVPAGLFLSGP